MAVKTLPVPSVHPSRPATEPAGSAHGRGPMMVEQLLVPLTEILVVTGWRPYPLDPLADEAERLVATCHGLDMDVRRDWANRPALNLNPPSRNS
jgi:hypothetical protein